MGRRHQSLDDKEIRLRPILRIFGLDGVMITPHDCRSAGRRRVCWARIERLFHNVGCLAGPRLLLQTVIRRVLCSTAAAMWKPPTKIMAQI